MNEDTILFIRWLFTYQLRLMHIPVSSLPERTHASPLSTWWNSVVRWHTCLLFSEQCVSNYQDCVKFCLIASSDDCANGKLRKLILRSVYYISEADISEHGKRFVEVWKTSICVEIKGTMDLRELCSRKDSPIHLTTTSSKSLDYFKIQQSNWYILQMN